MELKKEDKKMKVIIVGGVVVGVHRRLINVFVA